MRCGRCRDRLAINGRPSKRPQDRPFQMRLSEHFCAQWTIGAVVSLISHLALKQSGDLSNWLPRSRKNQTDPTKHWHHDSRQRIKNDLDQKPSLAAKPLSTATPPATSPTTTSSRLPLNLSTAHFLRTSAPSTRGLFWRPRRPSCQLGAKLPNSPSFSSFGPAVK
jgi:hypothetical protein